MTISYSPLFYTECGGQLLTANSLANLLRQLPAKPLFNRRYLEDYLLKGVCFRQANDTATLYQDIYRVPFGYQLQVIDGKALVTRRWSLSANTPIALNDQEAKHQLKAHLLASVRQCLPNTGPLAIELSGGLDSSTVAALARECLPNAVIHAFTNANPQSTHLLTCSVEERATYRFDETPYRKAVTQHLDLQQWLMADQQPFDFHTILEQYTEVLGAFSEVSFPLLNYPCYRRAQQLGVTSLLSGFGGDEMVSQQCRFYLAELKQQASAWRYRYEQLRSTPYQQWLNRFCVRPLLNKKNNLIMPDEHWTFLKPDLLAEYRVEKPVDFTTSQAYEYALIEGDLSTHLARRIETSTIIAAHHGITQHFPLTEPTLLQFFHALPLHLKRRHGMGRYLLRKTMQASLPRHVIWRKDKEGRTAPAANAAFMQQLPSLFLNRIPADYQGVLADYIDIARLSQYIEQGHGHESSVFRLAISVMMFAHLERWLEQLF